MKVIPEMKKVSNGLTIKTTSTKDTEGEIMEAREPARKCIPLMVTLLALMPP